MGPALVSFPTPDSWLAAVAGELVVAVGVAAVNEAATMMAATVEAPTLDLNPKQK